MVELAAAWTALVVAIVAVVALGRGAGAWRFALGAAMLLAGLATLTRPRAAHRELPSTPRDTPRGEYASSDACRSCHPSEHASWRRTFHRTMTQRASANTVLAPLDGAPLELDGRRFLLSRRGEEVWAKMPDLDALADVERRGLDPAGAFAPEVDRRLLVTTGSHHYQGYWVAGRRRGELRMLPFVWLLSEGRFLPRRDVFLQPAGAPQNFVRWNSNCIQCHSVGGRPKHDQAEDRFDTETVELGIACEACHGPGGAHVRRFRDPVARYAQHGRDEADPTIVNPARLPADRASAVCGQCHAYAYPRHEEEWWSSGYADAFRPGQELEPSRVLFSLDGMKDAGAPVVEAELESLFWRDGTVRVGGREHNAMVLSACFTRGQGERRLSCLSCHSMHDSDPDDMLARGARENGACTQCHEPLGAKLEEHTHHGRGSSGSQCVACHMPLTTYALLGSMRSHRIDRPSVRVAAETGRPHACNLCHLGESLGWTRDRSATMWGGERAALGERAEREPAMVAALLRGDAAARAIAAAAMGNREALGASGDRWQTPLLAELLVDPYAAVRLVALRALRAQRGFEGLDVGALATPADRARLRDAVLSRWERARPAGDRPKALPLRPDGSLDREAIDAMVAERADRAITIAE